MSRVTLMALVVGALTTFGVVGFVLLEGPDVEDLSSTEDADDRPDDDEGEAAGGSPVAQGKSKQRRGGGRERIANEPAARGADDNDRKTGQPGAPRGGEPRDEGTQAGAPGVLPSKLPALKPPEHIAQLMKPAKPHGEIQIDGDMRPAEAEKAFDVAFGQLRRCFVQRAPISNLAGGLVKLQFNVVAASGGGAVLQSPVLGSDLGDPGFAQCVQPHMVGLKVPLQRVGAGGKITVPVEVGQQDFDNAYMLENGTHLGGGEPSSPERGVPARPQRPARDQPAPQRDQSAIHRPAGTASSGATSTQP